MSETSSKEFRKLRNFMRMHKALALPMTCAGGRIRATACEEQDEPLRTMDFNYGQWNHIE